MRAQFINPFLQAAADVLEAELGSACQRGNLSLQKSAYTTDEVTTLVAVTGQVSGVVLYSMSEATARGIVSHLMGQEFPQFDELAQSGIGELGNVITGRATVLLAEAGCRSVIAPPALIIGRGTMLSTLDVQRIVVPVRTVFGVIDIQLALREQAATHTRAA